MDLDYVMPHLKVCDFFMDQDIQSSMVDAHRKIDENADVETLIQWLSLPPRFTIVRVNLHTTTREYLTQQLKILLSKKYEKKSATTPNIQPHELFDDVIVIKSDGLSKTMTQLQNNLESLKTNELSYVPGPFIIVGSHCGAAVLRGADIFAPGMLGVPHGISSGKTNVNVYVDTKDKTLQGTVTGTINDSKYFSTLDQRNLPPHFMLIGKGICTMSRQELFQTKTGHDNVSDNRANVLEENKEAKYSHNPITVKSGVAVTMVDCIFDCPSINEEYIKDMYMLQNMPSIIAGHALMSGEINSEQCEMILDMCAAPGGKTTHIASILSRRGKGKIIALDKNQSKVNHIIKNCRRFGVESIVETHVRDSTKLLLGDTNNISDGNKIPIFNENMFDRILLDAPCSALGQRPQFKISMKPKELASFPKIQRKLFDVAYKLLKPGGVLVYSTCTFTIEENEGLVQWAMDNYTDDLTVESLFPTEDKPSSSDAEKHSKLKRLLNLGEPGIIIQNGGQHSEHIQLARRFGLSRGKKYKDDENCDTIGFFIVKFRKTIK